ADPWHRLEDGPFPLNPQVQLPALALPATAVAPKLLLSRVIPASVFNRACQRTQNKHAVALGLVTDLLARMWERAGEERVVVTVDRQGGRKEYAPALAAHFPDAQVEVLLERPTYSAYRLRRGGGCLEVGFRVEAERGSWAVAAASLLCKY